MLKCRRLLRIAFVIYLLYQILLTLFMITAGAWISYDYNIPILLPFLSALFILASALVANKWELIGGGILILESISVVVWWDMLAGRFYLPNFSLFLPTFIVGVLFVLSWILKRKYQFTNKLETNNS